MFTKKYNTKCLAIDIKLQEQYESGAEENFKYIHQQGRWWEKIKSTLKNTAEKIAVSRKLCWKNCQICSPVIEHCQSKKKEF